MQRKRQSAHLHLTTLDIEAPEVELVDPKLGQDGGEGHAGDHLQLGLVHVLVPLALEAVAHELHNAGSGPRVHEMDILVCVTRRHQQADVVFSIANHAVVLQASKKDCKGLLC